MAYLARGGLGVGGGPGLASQRWMPRPIPDMSRGVLRHPNLFGADGRRGSRWVTWDSSCARLPFVRGAAAALDVCNGAAREHADGGRVGPQAIPEHPLQVGQPGHVREVALEPRGAHLEQVGMLHLSQGPDLPGEAGLRLGVAPVQ
jgi:hypothetical protein